MEERTETAPQLELEPKTEHKRVMPIHLLGSPILRQPAVLVPEITDDIRSLAEVMVNTMHHVNGVGLAAPQIGIPIRLFVMTHQAEGRVLRLMNPEIVTTEGEQEFDEGCLSQPGLVVHMKRPKYVSANAIDIDSGNFVIVEGTNLEAAILSHEIDHLNGKLICDYLSRLKRDMYKKKLKKKIKQHDRAEARQKSILEGAAKARDERDHPHFHEPHK
jgi:peptide deformylase